jgi:diketogulonate reductase-like aldo/keto reductase
VLAECERAGIAYLAYQPIAAGRLVEDDAVRDVAAGHGATPAQVALAWLLSQSPVVVPIPGTCAVSHVEENMWAARLQLTRADLAALTPGAGDD